MRVWRRPLVFVVLSWIALGLGIAAVFEPWVGVLVLLVAGAGAYLVFTNPTADNPEMPPMPGDQPAEVVIAAPGGLRIVALAFGLIAASLLAWWTALAFQGAMGTDHVPTLADRSLGVAYALSALALLVGGFRAAKA